MYTYYRNLSLFPFVRVNINHFILTKEKNNFFDGIKYSIIFDCFKFTHELQGGYYFLNSRYLVSYFLVFHLHSLNFLSFFRIYFFLQNCNKFFMTYFHVNQCLRYQSFNAIEFTFSKHENLIMLFLYVSCYAQ